MVSRSAPAPLGSVKVTVTAEPIDALRAHQIGLVNEVVPAADLAAVAQAYAERIAANAPLSVRAAKRMVLATRGLPVEEAYAEAERIFEPVYRSADAQEGPRAFAERRPPRWSGR